MAAAHLVVADCAAASRATSGRWAAEAQEDSSVCAKGHGASPRVQVTAAVHVMRSAPEKPKPNGHKWQVEEEYAKPKANVTSTIHPSPSMGLAATARPSPAKQLPAAMAPPQLQPSSQRCTKFGPFGCLIVAGTRLLKFELEVSPSFIIPSRIAAQTISFPSPRHLCQNCFGISWTLSNGQVASTNCLREHPGGSEPRGSTTCNIEVNHVELQSTLGCEELLPTGSLAAARAPHDQQGEKTTLTVTLCSVLDHLPVRLLTSDMQTE